MTLQNKSTNTRMTKPEHRDPRASPTRWTEYKSHKICYGFPNPKKRKSKQRTSSYETFKKKNCKSHIASKSGDWKTDLTFDKEQSPQQETLQKLSNGGRPNSQDCNLRRWQRCTVRMYLRCVTPKGNNPIIHPRTLKRTTFEAQADISSLLGHCIDPVRSLAGLS